MATVITIQPSPTAGSAAPVSYSSQAHHSPSDALRRRPHPSASATPNTLSPSPVQASSGLNRTSGRDGASCDACLRRRSRCAMNDITNKCYSCDFHRQDCTFTLSAGGPAEANTKKRKLPESGRDYAETTKRPSTVQPAEADRPVPESEMARPGQPHAMIRSGFFNQTTQHIGMTTELEPTLLEYLPLDEYDECTVSASRIRRCADDCTFMRVVNTVPIGDSQVVSLDAIESLVAPYGSTLVEKFFEHVHPSFPILMEDAFRQSYRERRHLSPLLLAAVYVLTLKFVDVGSGSQTARRPDAQRLESAALKLLVDSLPYPSISTIQAGLLLTQKSTLATASLNGQLVTAGFELGLHQDCTTWRMKTWEKGLRKRLAWALYMQDKWSSLVHGRPSQIFAFNWTVKDLVEQDFSDAFVSGTNSVHDDGDVGHGPLLFCHMVALTTILSDILDRFYTLQAIEDFRAAGNQRTRIILDKAKPAQIRLKEWFSSLPAALKMESSTGEIVETITDEHARNGALHLAYFATEITLHRCIVRSLAGDGADPHLAHICRSAAKTRLISAMDFVNRLRPAHLRSFWPASARTNFSLIGSFGMLLRVTAPTHEEAEFYRIRLCEYRWTLSVSHKNAEFMGFALESLDHATMLDKHVPAKPSIEELMANSAKQPSRPMMPSGSYDDAMGGIDMHDGTGASSSVISGLASPATSVSDIDGDDTPMQPL
ncbi:Fungal Zn(2)-Cys(6) binuclear cluster domain-containing protein [Penicillium ucsense]|uniref:Fungal Zn(2)-Cys(6) binuclear cluster domain-containing protein n=1 Tax=Penicillium ucsense TaxID=2839758 RepID=A0A8J8WG71_9EURO|nr:Fungal Zn(2)-Cys(6) binuclear cluster domain-containing protein [Penicillium ucsense]KAF7733436.1 Fungal Zn(2)-Cys(6) binuclear cluster domain-containing protein [Penicillium ucsense]